jgi:hypothetical protein
MIRRMRPATYAVLGVIAFVVAGAIITDPGGLEEQLAQPIAWGLAAFGLFAVIVAGIATGIRLARQ